MQILKQGGIGPVEPRQQALLEALEVVLVCIPPAVGHGHEVHPRFNEPPRQEA